jgi:hypothetical protein
MLCADSYTKEYVNACRAKIEQQVSAYERLMKAAGKPAEAAAKEFEPQFFGNMILALETHFVHRARGKEGTDGNPLNEVRMISASMIANADTLLPDKTIKYDPAKSILGLQIGDEIRITKFGYSALSGAFLAEIEAKYP